MKIVKVMDVIAVSEEGFAHATKLALRNILLKPRTVESIVVQDIHVDSNAFRSASFVVKLRVAVRVNNLKDL